MYENLVGRLRRKAGVEDFPDSIWDEAADAIEELSKPRWIPVTERLPEPYFDVLSTDGESVGIASYQKKGGYWLTSDVFYDAHVAVSHWMPLPEPPKEDA